MDSTALGAGAVDQFSLSLLLRAREDARSVPTKGCAPLMQRPEAVGFSCPAPTVCPRQRSGSFRCHRWKAALVALLTLRLTHGVDLLGPSYVRTSCGIAVESVAGSRGCLSTRGQHASSARSVRLAAGFLVWLQVPSLAPSTASRFNFIPSSQPVAALVPEPEALSVAIVEVREALRVLEGTHSSEGDVGHISPGSNNAGGAGIEKIGLVSRAATLLRRSLPVVGEAAAAVYARQRGPTLYMLLQMAKGEEPVQTLSPIDIERLESLERLTEEAIADVKRVAALAANPAQLQEQRRFRSRVVRNVRQILCELTCKAVRAPTGAWAGCTLETEAMAEEGGSLCAGLTGVSML